MIMYTCKVQLSIFLLMLGSLEEFIEIKKKFHLQNIFDQQSENENTISDTGTDNIKKKLLLYETEDKSHFLFSKRSKEIKKQQIAREKLRNAIQKRTEASGEKIHRDHWVDSNHFRFQDINPKNRLLRSVALTIQHSKEDRKQTSYQKSFDRVTNAYKKIKTYPIVSILPVKIQSVQQITKTEENQDLKPKLYLSNPHNRLKLENSIQWGKKHGKKVHSFYQQLGKSYQLIQDSISSGSKKKYHEIVRQAERKQDQLKRRGARQKFLKQIQLRVNTVPNSQKLQFNLS